ncbi:MAG: S41 family peptidase [Patescibacteria group bacterium]
MKKTTLLIVSIVISSALGCSCRSGVRNESWEKIRDAAAPAEAEGSPLGSAGKKNNGITPEEDKAIKEQQAIFYDIIRLYAEEALERPQDLVVCAREMLAMRTSDRCRDKFSRYLTPEEVKQFDADMEGKFGGVGIQFEMKDDKFIVVSPIEGGPAEAAGIKSGDIILKVSGKEPKSKEEVVSLLRGEVGKKVSLTIRRKNAAQPLEFILVRAVIVIKSVKSNVLPENKKIGVIKINAFDANSGEQFGKAAKNLLQRGVTEIVLDLRNNFGGDLHQALAVLMNFAKRGDTLLTIRTRKGGGAVVCRPLRCGFFPALLSKINIVVLVNGNSASASEIVAGTLKDWGYTLIGQKTYMKGVGQAVFTLSDGSRLILTTFEFLVGNSKTRVHKIGVIPTIEIPASEDKESDAEMEKAIEILELCNRGKTPPQGKCRR